MVEICSDPQAPILGQEVDRENGDSSMGERPIGATPHAWLEATTKHW
jgi:hypothetical protein